MSAPCLPQNTSARWLAHARKCTGSVALLLKSMSPPPPNSSHLLIPNSPTPTIHLKHACAGSVAPLPKYASPPVQRGIKSGCEPYTLLAAAYASGGKTPEELAVLAASHMAMYQQVRLGVGVGREGETWPSRS